VSRVSVVIPTLRRPEGLTRALRSVFSQDDALGDLREIIVLDNAPEGSARKVVDELTAESPVPLIYGHEPQPGVATARNAALRLITGELVAFLDDDEAAASGWLAALLRAHREHGADVTFGRVEGRATPAAAETWARPYLERLVSRSGPEASRVIQKHYGINNTLHTRETALAGDAPFDPAFDEIGGEDDVLFTRLREEGRRFVWTPEALVYEHVEPHRARMAYALRRAFGYGQGPSQLASYRGDGLGVAKWMLVGAAQVIVFGAVAAALWPLRHPRRADMLDRAAQGLGKVLWMPRFEPHLYGAAEVARSDAAEP
jgi:glycosyltransferase involved in cell wall biosynthesis